MDVNWPESANMAACAGGELTILAPLNCLAAPEREAPTCAGNVGGRHFYDCSYAGTEVLGAAVLTDQEIWRMRRRKRRLGKVWEVEGRPGRMMRRSARGSLCSPCCGDLRKSRCRLHEGYGWGGGAPPLLSSPHLTNSLRLPPLELRTPRTMTPPLAAWRTGTEQRRD